MSAVEAGVSAEWGSLGTWEALTSLAVFPAPLSSWALSVWHKLGWHLPAQGCPGAEPASILVLWRSGHGSVTLAGISVLFPYLSLILKAIDSLGISQKQGGGGFISSLSSGNFWMHNNWLLHPLPGSGHHCPISSQTYNTRARQCLGEPEIPFCFIRLNHSYLLWLFLSYRRLFPASSRECSHPTLPATSPLALHLLPAHPISWHPPAALVWAFQISKEGQACAEPLFSSLASADSMEWESDPTLLLLQLLSVQGDLNPRKNFWSASTEIPGKQKKTRNCFAT